MSTKEEVQSKIAQAKTAQELELIFDEFLGPEGKISAALKELRNLPPQERAERGRKLNEFKQWLERMLEGKKRHLKEILYNELEKKEWVDISLPSKKPAVGHIHPLSRIQSFAEEIFSRLGFEIAEGPEIEDERHNFDALNIPKDHPARDQWNTFWIKNPENSKSETLNSKQIQNSKSKTQKLLLRTHMSPVQIRYMETHEPPFRIIAPGRIFRYEATDASHEIQFYQLEGLMIDKDVTTANFKELITGFFKQFFGKEVDIRLRPGYFPFVEPGFEIDMQCVICGGRGCGVCKKSGWLEMMGAGMVHPNVFKAVGYTPKLWQGFAFGMGLDRFAMMKYKINDIRLFYSSDVRFLKQF